MSTILSRRALLALLTTPVLVAGCGPFGLSPTVAPTPPATPAGPAPAPVSTPSDASTTPSAPAAGAPSPAHPPATSVTNQADLTNARRGGRLVHGWLSDARTLNPLFATDAVSLHATSLLFNGLLRVNPVSLEPEADLAENWQIAPDGRGYTFTLRSGLVFHDGQPCTAEDVKFTYDLLLSERVNAPPLAELATVLESVTVTSPTSVEFQLKQAFAPFAAVHTRYSILPKHLLGALDPARIEQSDFSLAHPIGTGPFVFKDWTPGDQMTLARNDAYFAGPPWLDEIVLKVIPSQDTLHAHLQAGDVDLGLVRESEVEEMSRQPRLLISRVDTFSITYLGFQLDSARSELFQDKRVRQALAHGLDREALVREGRHGLGRVATGPVPPPSWAASDHLAGSLPYSPGQAEQLLDDAGWRKAADGVRSREGKKLSFELLTNRSNDGSRVREEYARLIQEAWRKIGVDARLVIVDFAEVVNRIRRTHDFDVFLAAFAFDVDPDQRLLWSTDAYKNGFNASRYSNPELDRLMTEAVRTSERERRRELYRQSQEILLDDLPAIVLDYPLAAYALNRRLHNVTPNAVSLSYNAHQWWVTGDA